LLTIRVYLHSFSCYCLRNSRNVAKFQENLTLQQFNGKLICDFLLVINCNFSRICYRFRDIRRPNRFIFAHTNCRPRMRLNLCGYLRVEICVLIMHGATKYTLPHRPLLQSQRSPFSITLLLLRGTVTASFFTSCSTVY